MRLGLGISDEFRLEGVAELLLRGGDDESVVIGHVHVVHDKPRFQRQEEVDETFPVVRFDELSGRGEAGHQLSGASGVVRLVLDLLVRDLGKDRRLVGKLGQDQLIRLIQRDSDHHDQSQNAHQHISADERSEQARCEKLLHNPS